MSRMGAFLVAGYLAFAAGVGRADKPVQTAASPQTDGVSAEAGTAATPVEMADLPPPGQPATSCGWFRRCLPSGTCARRLWQWATYRPESCPRTCSQCGRLPTPTCFPPLYTYFLWHCANCSDGHAPGPPAAVPDVGHTADTAAAHPTASDRSLPGHQADRLRGHRELAVVRVGRSNPARPGIHRSGIGPSPGARRQQVDQLFGDRPPET